MLANLIGKLNPEQFQAVTTIDGPLLIIAGAGSGKTRVITFRIANMLESGIPQHQILALTFTNKAAKEMAERIQELVGRNPRALTVSTFHAFGVQILRKHHARLGFRPNFTIYDDSDQQNLIRECAREQGIPNDEIEYQTISSVFSKLKTRRLKLSQVDDRSTREMYVDYQERLQLYNAADFDDLILLPIRLFEEHPDVLEEYRKTFRYIMVDEFQDTSLLQYQLLHLIAQQSQNVCVVGDDDQSIYSWRGANFENIGMFERDYPQRVEIKLEQNYRSTGTILEAANSLIANNKQRKTKALWTPSGSGNAIELYQLQNEVDEALFIAKTIKTICFKEQMSYDDVGVLIRTNALSRYLEEAFLAENLPYRMSGGTSFFQRPEIKDIISYLRIISNPDDDVSFLRIINTPRRGIGKKTIEGMTKAAIKHSASLFKVMEALANQPSVDDLHQDLFAEAETHSSPERSNRPWEAFGLDPAPGEAGGNTMDDDPYELQGKSGTARKNRKHGPGEGYAHIDVSDIQLSKTAKSALGEMVDLVHEFRSRLLSGKQIAEATRRLIHEIDYWGFLLSEFESNEKIAQWRQHNIEIFCTSIEKYEKNPDNQPASIFTYLNRITLDNRDELEDDQNKGSVNLMTVHASKGLEFSLVFLAGVEDGVMPHKRSLMENEEGSYESNMEEERRLFYVAITRAKEKLIMTSCRTRTQLRQTIEQALSPFLKEIPSELITFKEPVEEETTEEDADSFFANLKERFKPLDEAENDGKA